MSIVFALAELGAMTYRHDANGGTDMTHIYKKGDRVRLVTDAGYDDYPECKPGALGTVYNGQYENGAADVFVDGCSDDNLHFFASEIEPYDERATEADITTDKPKTLAEMTDEEAMPILLAWKNGEAIEEFDGIKWQDSHYSYSIFAKDAYRLLQTQDTIPWDAISQKYNWSARDEDGKIWVYGEKPFMRDDTRDWDTEVSDLARIDHIMNITPGNVAWQESLQCRPGYEGE